MSSKHRTQPQCQSCARPVTDQAYLCGSCGDKIARSLGDIPALVADLAVTYTRQAKGDTQFGHSANTALPWSEKASEALEQLRTVLTAWVARLLEQHGGNHPGANPTLMARWLSCRVDWIRRHPSALSALDEIDYATSEINYVMDLHAERWYAGTCREVYDHPETDDDDAPVWPACCLAELYVKPGSEQHACHRCKKIHDVDARRDWLLKIAEDRLFHAELIGRALAAMGEAVTPAMIRNYADRGRIVAHGLDRKGRPTYRVGDVVEVVRTIALEKSARDAKRAIIAAKTASLCA